MKRTVRRIARPQPGGPRTWVCWATAINLLFLLIPAGAETVRYQLPTHDLIRRIEQDQALEQQRSHEMAVAAHHDARVRQFEEAVYQMGPVKPSPTRCEPPARFAYVHPHRPAGSTGRWRIVSEPSLPPLPPTQPMLVPPSGELAQQRDQLARQAQQLEMEIAKLHQDTDRRRQEIEHQLRQTHEQIARVDEELARQERQRQERQRQLLMEVQRQAEQLGEQARMLQEQTGRIQQTLGEIHRPQAAMPQRPAPGPASPPQPVEGQMPRPIRELPPVEPLRHEPAPPARPQIKFREHDDEDQATREFREKIRQELNELREADEHTRQMLKRLLFEDHPSTVGTAGQSWRW